MGLGPNETNCVVRHSPIRALPVVMLRAAPNRVFGHTGVVRAIRAFEDIAEVHRLKRKVKKFCLSAISR